TRCCPSTSSRSSSAATAAASRTPSTALLCSRASRMTKTSATRSRVAFALRCSVRTGDDVVRLDVRVTTEPVVQVVEERLRLGERDLLATDPPRPDSGDIIATWDADQPAGNSKVTFRASRLLSTQVLARIP